MIRVLNTFRRFALLLPFCFSAVSHAEGSIVINEIHHDPDIKTELTEFIELYNRDTVTVNLSGWRLDKAVEYAFPNSTTLGAGKFLVVSMNPGAFQTKFGGPALGPWQGRLDNEGETIELRDARGGLVDRIDYKLGFPWPIVGSPPGYSIELIHPGLDNDLGGSWRASVRGGAVSTSQTLISKGTTWNYFKGNREASTPRSSWRKPSFQMTNWNSGRAPIGYGENFMKTNLGDMRNTYSTVYFRKSFRVADLGKVGALSLEIQIDDGFNAWINGTHVAAFNVPGQELSNTRTANSAIEDHEFKLFNLPSPAGYIVKGNNLLAIQGHNASKGGSSDFFMDARLVFQSGPVGRGPTPGVRNAVFAENTPPHVRQVGHSPKRPISGQPVVITAKITDADGVGAVTLDYQVVRPGHYIAINDAAYETEWTAIPMNDNGEDGDAGAGDHMFTGEIPANVQSHRHMVRYRLTARDAGGRELRSPLPGDPCPNFAYFIHNGVANWKGAVRRGQQVVEYDEGVMNSLPIYYLISKNSDIEDATWNEKYGGDTYKWKGTLVYDGRVYDHIRYRARGGVWRYAMGKNMWKFDFNRGNAFQARDNFGGPIRTGWDKLNFSACIQQGNFQHRGEQGMFEAAGFKLFELAGVPSPKTHWVHFRVIDGENETGRTQYEGDFWGLYLVLEQMDGRFLDEHGLPDGNLYKMEGGTGDLNNQGSTAVTNKSDLNNFMNTYNGRPSDNWWRQNLDLGSYYGYRTIVEGIHHFDIGYGKNYFYYLNPETRQWSVLPWDLDLTWADNMYGNGNEPFKSKVINRSAFRLEYRNRAREILDLLFNEDEGYKLLDELAAMIDDPDPGQPSIVDADRARWDYEPIMTSGKVNSSKAGSGRFYRKARTKDFPGMVDIMKRYITSRKNYIERSVIRDTSIPTTPMITSINEGVFPVNNLHFRCSDFRDNSGSFGAINWRIAEVNDPTAPAFDPDEPKKFEIQAKWESEPLSKFTPEFKIPPGVTAVGRWYRVRARVMDDTGRWSHWSDPVQFQAAEPDNLAFLREHLSLTELMYHSPKGNGMDYIELHNTSKERSLNLAGVRISSGVSFTFPDKTDLAPGAFLLVAGDPDSGAFHEHYQLDENFPVLGPFEGSLSNKGEQVSIKSGVGGTLLAAVDYDDSWGWPLAADGLGHSLTLQIRDPRNQAARSLDYGGNWKASVYIGGSPGRAEPVPDPEKVWINEIMAHTDFNDPEFPSHDSNDWVELHNAGIQDVNLGGWFLSDDPANLNKWAIPNRLLPVNGLAMFDEVSNFHSPITDGFGLNKDGEWLFLSRLRGESIDRVAGAIRFKGQDSGLSLSRQADGFFVQAPPSQGMINYPPRKTLVISEVHYHPTNAPGQPEVEAGEYVELHNTTGSAIALSSTKKSWRLSGGIAFEFPPGSVIPAGDCLLVVGFDPAKTNPLDKVSCPLIGPFQGRLDNRTDRVFLEYSQEADFPGDPVSWVVADRVIYSDQPPWPEEADGKGQSLHRALPGSTGLNPAEWWADSPTPGQVSGEGATDSDGDGMTDAWELAHGLNPSIRDDDRDDDRDGLNNLAEFVAGTHPGDAASAVRVWLSGKNRSSPRLHFFSMPGRAYRVESSVSLRVWVPEPGVPTVRLPEEEAGKVVGIDLQSAVKGIRFYRVRVSQEP